VVVGLGEPGDGDDADDPDVGDPDGERPAVRGVVGGVDAECGAEDLALGGEAPSDEVGRGPEAFDDADLAGDPGVVVGGAAGQGGVEELLAAAADVDGDGQVAAGGEVDEQAAEVPGVGVVEAGEDEALLVLLEPGDQGGDVVVGHGDHCAGRVGGPGARRDFVDGLAVSARALAWWSAWSIIRCAARRRW
jgi:hypothetical protein